jgi:hypothetical protein
MDSKLTVKMDQEIIAKAKKYAALQGRSLSDLLESYLKSLVIRKKTLTDKEIHISPFVKSLSGKFKLPVENNYKNQYIDYLDKKYK